MEQTVTLIMIDGSSRSVTVSESDREAFEWWMSNERKPNPMYIEGVLYLRETVKGFVPG